MVKRTERTKPLSLLPQPKTLRLSEPLVPAASMDVVDRHDPALGAEAYRLDIDPYHAVITAASERGARYGRTTLAQLAEAYSGHLPQGSLEDTPALPTRGVIEGFYGEPWSHQQRLVLFPFMARVKMNSYVYAPKDDPYHRDRWREPYPDVELAALAELALAAREASVDFVFAIHPAVTMQFSNERDHELLANKVRQVASVGIERFALLFDDVPPRLENEADIVRYGADSGALGTAHAEAVDRLARTVRTSLIVVPMDYAGTQYSDYRIRFAAGIPSDALVWWTGRDVVVGEITREDIDAVTEVFGDRLALWDNFPVNDFDPGRAFLGPLTGRTREILGSGLRGAWSNPMVECAPSRFGIASFADWAWNPVGYDPDRSARAALPLVAGADARTLAPLVRTLSSWPPSAPMDPELVSLTAAVLDGAPTNPLRDRLTELSDLGAITGGSALIDELHPWLAAAGKMGKAGLAALDLWEDRPGASAAKVSSAIDDAQSCTAKIAVDVIPSFVEAVISRTG